ncbi:MAG: hypothetical protein HQK59_13625 [Deltaproteobacteria bacterium]|nr:hypothetical protein [Deltaproteobacteria bacterium]
METLTLKLSDSASEAVRRFLKTLPAEEVELVSSDSDDQSYLWTKEWQEGEALVDREIAEGNLIGPFDNVDEMMKSFKKLRK